MLAPLPPRVLKARLQLMLAHPYLAGALARLPVINAASFGWCDTMATDGYYIYVNPAFCEALKEEEIAGVFAHEVLHCVLGHLDRRGGRERFLWNVAIDYATNLLLTDFGFQLPSNGLHDPRFRGLTSEEIYAQIEQKVVACRIGAGFDRHIEAGDAEGQAQRRLDYPSPEERRRLRSAVLREMAESARRRKGNLPLGLQREIESATQPQVSWQQLLARFMSDLRRSDYRLYPFNKKHLWRGIYLPSVGVPGPDHLVLAIDTSGSVSGRELGQFVGELDRLRSFTDCRLTLLHCDAAVQRVDESSGRDKTILPEGKERRLAGGGGTDFRPVFDWVAEKAAREGAWPDALIYCTDGAGTFPAKAPRYPVVWVATPGCTVTFPFGLVIALKKG